MYNLQAAKEEIDTIAKHTTGLAEHVIAISERLQALEGGLQTKLDNLKHLIGAIEGQFSDLQKAVVGSEPHHFETSAVADLSAKMALLRGGHAEPTHSSGGSEHGGPVHHDDGPHDGGDHSYQSDHH